MIDIALEKGADWPAETDWQQWAEKSIAAGLSEAGYANILDSEALFSISIILSDDTQIRDLNHQYRSKDKATNVLSFPMLGTEGIEALPHAAQSPEDGIMLGEIMLGDLALAYQTCANEAENKGFSVQQHAAHLIIHGTLHLLGHDHIEDEAADAMEALEIKALASMGLPNPYSNLP